MFGPVSPSAHHTPAGHIPRRPRRRMHPLPQPGAPANIIPRYPVGSSGYSSIRPLPRSTAYPPAADPPHTHARRPRAAAGTAVATTRPPPADPAAWPPSPAHQPAAAATAPAPPPAPALLRPPCHGFSESPGVTADAGSVLRFPAAAPRPAARGPPSPGTRNRRRIPSKLPLSKVTVVTVCGSNGGQVTATRKRDGAGPDQGLLHFGEAAPVCVCACVCVCVSVCVCVCV